MAKDLLAEIVDERTALNPEFPRLLAEAETRRKEASAQARDAPGEEVALADHRCRPDGHVSVGGQQARGWGRRETVDVATVLRRERSEVPHRRLTECAPGYAAATCGRRGRLRGRGAAPSRCSGSRRAPSSRRR